MADREMLEDALWLRSEIPGAKTNDPRGAMCRCYFFFSSRRRHTRLQGDWSSDVCSSDLSLGDKAGCPPLRQGFVGFGYAIASVNHRFSSDVIYPAQLEDLKAAVRWLRAHATEFNLDSAHLSAWGASSGGHLVALLGTTGEIKDFDVGENLDQPSRVEAVVDFFGFSDFAQLGGRR